MSTLQKSVISLHFGCHKCDATKFKLYCRSHITLIWIWIMLWSLCKVSLIYLLMCVYNDKHELWDFASPWHMATYYSLGQGSMYRSRHLFLQINGWAGEKMMVPCAHPSHPRTSTPNGWVSHILCCARTGANGRAVLTVTRRTCAG